MPEQMQSAQFDNVLQPRRSISPVGSDSESEHGPVSSPRESLPDVSPQRITVLSSPTASPTTPHTYVPLTTPFIGHGASAPSSGPRLQFLKAAEDSRTGGVADGSPSSRVSASPKMPAYQAGAVQSMGFGLGALGGSPTGPGMSPYGQSPPASFAVFNAGGMTPGSTTPGADGFSPMARHVMRSPSDGNLSNLSPSRRAGYTGGLSPMNRLREGMDGLSPSRRRLDRRSSNLLSKIDPDQVPRPIGLPDAVKEEGGKVYDTLKYHVPPPASSVCTIVDRGSASCEFMRLTVNQIPAYPSTANTAHVPIAVVCQPFAELTPFEDPVPVVNFGETGPMRCPRCKAYVNPHFSWHNGGQEASCNFCAHRFEVSREYVCSLDERGHRRDLAQRPELRRGTVDYIAPKDYSDSEPVAPAICFVIEVSQKSVQSGLFAQVIWTLKSLLTFLEKPAPRIAIMTFDSSLHFFAFYSGLDSARQMTVADIEDPFAPCGANVLCIDVEDPQYRGQVESLLDQLPELFMDTKEEQVAGGAALKAATDLIGSRGGGQVIMFHASLSSTGVAALRLREEVPKPSASEQELKELGTGLLTVQHQTFFDEVTADCLNRSVAVSVFCAAVQGGYLDMATLTVVPRKTGGEIFHYPFFDAAKDGEKLHYDLSRTVVQPAAFSAVLKLRCSKGLTVDNMLAIWEPEVIDTSTFHVSRLSVDACCTFVLSHSERIEGQRHVYLQAACLYTTRAGQRLIRVHTIQLQATSSLSNVFRYTEVECVANVLFKQAAAAALNGTGGFKDKMNKCCVDMLHAYRVNCASMTSAGQLILPESLKLLPLFIGAARKTPAFRIGADVRIDDRVFGLLRLLSLTMPLTAAFVYPHVYTLFPLSERAGCPTGVGDNVFMPPCLPCSSHKIATDRIYLLDNGFTLNLYVRPDFSYENMRRVFGVEQMSDIPLALQQPEENLSLEASRMLAIVQQIRRERSRHPYPPLYFALPGTFEEFRVQSLICEDRMGSEMQYVDFLCHLHKMVQHKQD